MSTYREWVDEEEHEEQQEQHNQEDDEVPLVVGPDDVAQRLEWGREPQERSIRSAVT